MIVEVMCMDPWWHPNGSTCVQSGLIPALPHSDPQGADAELSVQDARVEEGVDFGACRCASAPDFSHMAKDSHHQGWP